MPRYFCPPDAYLALSFRPDIAISRLELPHSPQWLRGKTLLFASDFHQTARSDPQIVISKMKACRADLILLGGDFADTRDQAMRLFDALSDLRAPMGIYAVCGNNDAEAFADMDALADTLPAKLLVNESVRIACGEGTLAIGGVDEHLRGHPDASRLFPCDSDYRILLSHYPILPDCHPDLMLCGHTHGGQFNLLGVTPYAVGFERIGKKRRLAPAMASGFRSIEGVPMLVSKGIGTSRIPLRVGVRPEIHQICFC